MVSKGREDGSITGNATRSSSTYLSTAKRPDMLLLLRGSPASKDGKISSPDERS